VQPKHNAVLTQTQNRRTNGNNPCSTDKGL